LRKNSHLIILLGLMFSVLTVCAPGQSKTGGSTHAELVELFREFREFQKPELKDGVPNYSAAAMQKQWNGLKDFQLRLADMDISDWPRSQQVDFHIVKAEMNGLEFYHRILKPWQRDPVFYLFSQAGAGPVAYGRPRLSRLPLPDVEREDLEQKLRAVPPLLDQARANLNDASGDLALIAIYFLKDEIALYETLNNRLMEHHPELLPAVADAKAAVSAYGDWLEKNKGSMTALPGVGKEHYNWYLKNVQLVPFTWEELLPSLEREYEQAVAALKIEENRNRNLPPLKLVSSQEEYQRLWSETEKYLKRFVEENEIFTIPDYIESYDPGEWWNSPGSGHAQDFFEQCRDRDMLAEVCHNYLGHNLDGLRHSRDDRPIRGENRLYAIDMIRSEGVAYGFEELLRLAGMYADRPRGPEIHFAMKAFRVVRGLADLKLHSHDFTLEEAIQFCYDYTPHQWMLKDGFEAWYEMQTSLRFPGWHMGFNLGKMQLFNLIEDGARVRRDDFVLGDYIDEFFAAGMIPFSLTRWEMLGLTDEIEKLR
jgi:hypothetical protein